MLLMLRRFSFFVLIIAALTVAEPLLHNHPLQQNSIPDACAICATGAVPVPSAPPAICAPHRIAYTIASVAVTIVTRIDALSVPSRAPPSV